MLDGSNPGHLMFLDPLVAWTKALRDGVLDKETLKHAWHNALHTAGLADSPTSAAEGATGAYVACLKHLGWEAPHFDKIRTDGLDAKGSACHFMFTKKPTGCFYVYQLTIDGDCGGCK